MEEYLSPFDARWEIIARGSGASRAPEDASFTYQRCLGLRLRTTLPAIIQWSGGVARCNVIELSTSGCVLSRTPALRTGTRALLLLRAQGLREPLILRCRVVRPVPRGHAMELVAVTDHQRLGVAELLDRVQDSDVEAEGGAPFPLERRLAQSGRPAGYRPVPLTVPERGVAPGSYAP